MKREIVNQEVITILNSIRKTNYLVKENDTIGIVFEYDAESLVISTIKKK